MPLDLILFFSACACRLDNGDEGGVDMWCFLIHVQVSRDDVFPPEGVEEVLEAVGAPSVELSCSFDACHILGRSREVDTDGSHLIAADFSFQSGMLQAMLDGGRAIFHSLGVFDECPIEVRATFVSILRMRRPLDV